MVDESQQVLAPAVDGEQDSGVNGGCLSVEAEELDDVATACLFG